MVAAIDVGGVPVCRLTQEDLAEEMVADAKLKSEGMLPKMVFSLNGQALSLLHTNSSFKNAMSSADIVHADGQSIVLFCRAFVGGALPERIATTDFFHVAARAAEREGLRFYMLGGDAATIERAAATVRRLYPDLALVGWRDGYFTDAETPEVLEAVRAAKPDVLWIGMGKPREQLFAQRHQRDLAGIAWLKTCGGLFDFLAGNNRRAPVWMQNFGLEWLFRASLEPRRLAWRYATTNVHATAIMIAGLKRSRATLNSAALEMDRNTPANTAAQS